MVLRSPAPWTRAPRRAAGVERGPGGRGAPLPPEGVGARLDAPATEGGRRLADAGISLPRGVGLGPLCAGPDRLSRAAADGPARAAELGKRLPVWTAEAPAVPARCRWPPRRPSAPLPWSRTPDGRAIVEGGPATREDARLPPRAGPRRPDGHPKPTGAALATASDRVPLDGIHFSHPRKALPRRADALWVTRNGTKNWAKRHTGLRNSRMSSSPRPQLYGPSLGGLSGVEMATGRRQWRTRVGVQPGLHGLRALCSADSPAFGVPADGGLRWSQGVGRLYRSRLTSVQEDHTGRDGRCPQLPGPRSTASRWMLCWAG